MGTTESNMEGAYVLLAAANYRLLLSAASYYAIVHARHSPLVLTSTATDAIHCIVLHTVALHAHITTS